MGASRRRTLRFRCDLPARWTAPERVAVARVLNVSDAGLLLGGVDGVALGDHVEVEVDLDGRPVHITAEVRFCGATRHGAGCGVAIAAMAGADRARWRSHYRGLAERAIAGTPTTVQRYLRRRTGSDA